MKSARAGRLSFFADLSFTVPEQLLSQRTLLDKGDTEVRASPPWEIAVVKVIRFIPGMKSAAMNDRIRKAIHGSSWTLAGYGISQTLRLVAQIVLAHLLLGPSAFGLVAL